MELSTTLRVVSKKGNRNVAFGALLAESPATLLYFYPKDNTPGCTLEARDFTSLKQQFEKAGIAVV